jgi:transposase InsO family protein
LPGQDREEVPIQRSDVAQKAIAPAAKNDLVNVMVTEHGLSVRDNPSRGFDKLYPSVRGPRFGKCRLYRVYRALRLNIKRRGMRRLPDRVKTPPVIPERPNEVWSADFMSDALWSGRRFRTFNVIDDFNREALRMDNGPELISDELEQWARRPISPDWLPVEACHARVDWHPNRRRFRSGPPLGRRLYI